MNKNAVVSMLAIAGVVAACSSEPQPPDTGGVAKVGPAGGAVKAGGATLTIPADALDAETEITIAPGAPAPADTTVLSPVFRFTPEGLTFKKAATVEFDFTPGSGTPFVFWSKKAGDGFDHLPTTVAGTRASAEVMHFSIGGVGASATGSGSTADFAQDYCDKLFACIPMDARPRWPDAARCAVRTKALLDGILAAPDVSIDPAGLAACNAAIASGTCAELLDTGLSVEDPLRKCNFKGPRADGAKCGVGAQCASGFCSGFGMSCGTCKPLIPENGNCALGETCAFDLQCGFGPKCVKPGGEGAACDGTNPPCSRDLECHAGKCTKHLALGDACVLGENERTCNRRQAHACTNGKCTEDTFSPVGGSCAHPLKCAGAKCVSNVCTAYVADGTACGTSESSPQLCEPPARCTSGSCKLLDPASCG